MIRELEAEDTCNERETSSRIPLLKAIIMERYQESSNTLWLWAPAALKARYHIEDR